MFMSMLMLHASVDFFVSFFSHSFLMLTSQVKTSFKPGSHLLYDYHSHAPRVSRKSTCFEQRIELDPVHTEPDEFGIRRIFVQIRLAFTRDPRNRTNSSTANRTNSRPKKIRPRFLRDRSQILTNPCEHRNRSFTGLICTVGNWNELGNAMKPGLSNKLTRSIDVLKTTTRM